MLQQSVIQKKNINGDPLKKAAKGTCEFNLISQDTEK